MDNLFKISYSGGWAVVTSKEVTAYDRYNHPGKIVYTDVLAGERLFAFPFLSGHGIPRSQKGHVPRVTMSFHGHKWAKIKKEPLTEADLPQYMDAPLTTDDLSKAIKGEKPVPKEEPQPQEAATRVASRFIAGSR